MSTMRKLRRASQTAKHKIEPLRHKQPPLARKMSEVLLDFAEPLLDTFEDDEDFEGVISLAALCWNCSFLPPKKQRAQLNRIVNELGKSDLLTRLEIEDCTRMLLERKKALFADDRRMVVDYKVVEEEEGQRLLVMSTPAKD
jgi:hypothetical protein